MARPRTPIDELTLARIMEAIEPMKREIYAQGWKDAVAAISRSANTLLRPPEVKSGPKPKAGNGATPNRLPAPDSNFGRVLAIVQQNPGLRAVDAVKATAQAGHAIPSESVRACLQRLQKRQLVVNRESRWFPIDTERGEGASEEK